MKFGKRELELTIALALIIISNYFYWFTNISQNNRTLILIVSMIIAALIAYKGKFFKK